MRREIAGVCALVVAAGAAWGQCGEQRLVASDRSGGDALGYSVAMRSGGGSYSLLMGAPYEDNARGVDAGAVYAFARSGQTWYESFKITPPISLAGGFFGSSVGLFGAESIIGAEGGGHVFIYQRTGNEWGLHRGWQGSIAESFGHDVAMANGVAVNGAPLANVLGDAGAGLLYFYERNGGSEWFYTGTLGQEDFYRSGADWLGWSVATNGPYVFAGAPRGDNGGKADCGWVLVANKTGGSWSRSQTLIAPGYAAGDRFGQDVAMEGVWAVLGAPYATVAGKAEAGLAHVYYFNGGYWQHVTALQPYPVYAGARFGSSVSITSGRIAVSCGGNQSAFVFEQAGFAVWNQIARMTDPDSGASTFARSITIDGDRVVVGDTGYDGGVTDAGAGYLYTLDPDVSDSCGGAVAVTQGTYVGCTSNAVLDGSSSCSGLSPSPDVFFRYTAPASGTVTFDSFGSAFDTVLSVHSACPATSNNEIGCNDDWSVFEQNARLGVRVTQGASYIVRLGGIGGERGSFVLNVSAVEPDPCPADFNGDGVVNTLDFIAFLNAWNAGDARADFNGDGAVNTIDVLGYLNAFVAGC